MDLNFSARIHNVRLTGMLCLKTYLFCRLSGEVGNGKSEADLEQASGGATETIAENIDGKNDTIPAKEMDNENEEEKKSGNGSDQEGKQDNVDGGSKEIDGDEGGSILDEQQSAVPTADSEEDLASPEPSDSENSNKQNESEKGTITL
jgi:hypothetical protein